MKQFFKFIFSGGSAALSKLILFLLLFSFFRLYYLLASTLAFLFSVGVGFLMQKYITFENYSKEDTKKQATMFVLVSLINLLINILLMFGFVQILKLNEIISQIMVIGIIACWNFFLYKNVVFVTLNDKIPYEK